MNVFYHTAEDVVSVSQRNLNGGVFTFVLDQLTDSLDFSLKFDSLSFSTHFVNTISSGGFLAGIFFGFLWCVGLLVSFIYMWWLRSHNKAASISHQLVQGLPPIKSSKKQGINSPKKSTFFFQSHRLQSNWMCIAFQCVALTLSVGLLFLFCCLGFVASYSLHSSLISEPSSPLPLPLPRNPKFSLDSSGLFLGITSALRNARVYLTEFLNDARTATKPAVDDLIKATVEMQNMTSHEFNALLFSMLGIDRAFDLGDKLGAHTVSLLNLVTPLKHYLIEYTDTVSSLSMAIARWNGYMEQIHMEKNLTATKLCEANSTCDLPILVLAEVTVSSKWRLPQFDFVIALNFVTDAQNRTPEVIEEQLKSSRLLAARQLEHTMERMRVEIDVPGSLRNLIEQNFINIAQKLNGAIVQIDNLAEVTSKKFYPLVVVGSNYILAIFCFMWLVMLSIALGIIMLLYHFHCSNGVFKSQGRQKICCVASFAYILLIFCICVSCTVFLVSGYAHTEFCRYVSPDWAATALEAEENANSHIPYVLDTHINVFLDKNWGKIIEMLKEISSHDKGDEIPLPLIRSPIYALNAACKENAGILDALGAVDKFNFSVLSKPEVINEFVYKGRDIVRDTLIELNATEMFPPSLVESVQLASRLDDFLIPFDKVRQELSKNFLNVTSKNKTTLMSGVELAQLWQDYYSFLKKSNLSYETLTRADELAGIVFNLSSGIKTLLEFVDESLQKLEKLQKIGPTVSELQGIFDSLGNRLRDREELIAKAMELYDSHVALNLPKKAEELIIEHGPPLLREVGRCRKLHDAYTTGVSAVCDFVVGPLNGVWFFSGLCILLSTVLIPLGLLLLLHKIPSFPHVASIDSNEPLGIASHEQDGVKPGQALSSVNGVRVVQPPGIHSLIRGQNTGPTSSPSYV